MQGSLYQHLIPQKKPLKKAMSDTQSQKAGS